jgi:hypothetical protein
VLRDGRAPPRRADGSCAGGLGDPIPFPPREKIVGLMVGLADTHSGNPTRLLARSRRCFAPGMGTLPTPAGFQKRDGRLVARVLIKKTGHQS